MKRYLLFIGLDYDCAYGGWRDFKGDADTPEELVKEDGTPDGSMGTAYDSDLKWWHIVDTETREIVKEGEFRYGKPFVLPE